MLLIETHMKVGNFFGANIGKSIPNSEIENGY